jgi:hypothetical protein
MHETESGRSSLSVPDEHRDSLGDEESGRGNLLFPTRVDSQGSILSDFGLEPYVERTISPKEVVRVEISYVRPSYGTNVVLKWDYSCRTEQTPAFSIHYIPDSLDINEMTSLLPYGQSGSRVLFPSAYVNCYAQPAYGVIPVSHLNSGRFVFTWDNSSSFSKRFFKSIAYKTLITNSDLPHEIHASIHLPRKSTFALPMIHGPLNGGNANEIMIDFNTQSLHVPFSLHYDPIDGAKLTNESDNLSSRLQDAMSGSSPQPRRTMIPFNRNKSNIPVTPTSHVVPIKDHHGVFTLIWDNSTSIVTGRNVDLHVRIK